MEPVGPWATRPVVPSSDITLEPETVPQQSTLSDQNTGVAIPPVNPPSPPQSRAAQRTASVSSLAGRWTLKEANGVCQVQLSTSSTLDLYKASTSSCKNAALQEINTWALRDGSVELYAKGRLVMRLQENGSDYVGMVDRGQVITMTR
ncbi:protease inhibitor Inh/omp19 family protein [Microvirga sp. WGZ8]|uniref:Protease inhibitor Inh/omp19 family protein n=2 Tax=Microvirga puerhi TaxID=2876078 RepID=A0ABS7VUF5_9HYPH|nr:protease inhibitor Inh/omp19 family protein [Microvirga puerhi]